MLPQLSHDWIKVALRVSEEDGPCAGDLSLLHTLLVNEIVYKRVENTSNVGYIEYPTAREHFIPPATRYKQSGMINLLRMTAKMTVESDRNDKTNELLSIPEKPEMANNKGHESSASTSRNMLQDSAQRLNHNWQAIELSDMKMRRSGTQGKEPGKSSESAGTLRPNQQSSNGDNHVNPKAVELEDMINNESKEKYLRLNDLIQVLLEGERVQLNKRDFILKVLHTLVQETDEIHIERTIQVICDFEQVDIVFTLVDMFVRRSDSKKNALVEMILVMLYNEALSRQWTHVGMRIMKGFQETILRNDKRVLPALL